VSFQSIYSKFLVSRLQGGPMMELSSNLCVEVVSGGDGVEMKQCNLSAPTQLWNFTHYNPHYYHLVSEGSAQYPNITSRFQTLYRAISINSISGVRLISNSSDNATKNATSKNVLTYIPQTNMTQANQLPAIRLKWRKSVG
jgi:hypothetical protein